jgi:hypothetical protein
MFRTPVALSLTTGLLFLVAQGLPAQAATDPPAAAVAKKRCIALIVKTGAVGPECAKFQNDKDVQEYILRMKKLKAAAAAVPVRTKPRFTG